MRGAMYERMKKLEPAEAEFRKVLDSIPTAPARSTTWAICWRIAISGFRNRWI